MFVIGAREGQAGPDTEKAMIRVFTDEFNDPKADPKTQPCKNKKVDSRGLSGKPGVVNFLYICQKVDG